MGVQRRTGRGAPARRGRLAGAASGRLPDRGGARRALSRAAGGLAGDRRTAAPRRARERRHQARHRQAQGRRPRRGAVRVARGAGRHGASLPRLGGDRRVGYVDAAEPARRRRAPRGRRARPVRADRLRDPGRAGRRPRALCGAAGARGRQRSFGVQRDPRSRRAARVRSGDGDRVGDPRRSARAQVRRRRRRRAPRARRAGDRCPRPRRGRRGRAPQRLRDAGARRARRATRRGGRRAPGGRRRGDRGHRLPARPLAARRVAAGSRRSRRGAAQAGTADRSEPALLRHRAPARRRRALTPRPRRLHGRHEELRPRADVPHAHGLRAGPLDRRRAGRATGSPRAGSSSSCPRPASATAQRRTRPVLSRPHGRRPRG